jgi:hypothetical protein
MDMVEKNIIFSWEANKFWGISVTSFFDHLYGKIRSRKIGLPCVLIEEEDKTIVAWF